MKCNRSGLESEWSLDWVVAELHNHTYRWSEIRYHIRMLDNVLFLSFSSPLFLHCVPSVHRLHLWVSSGDNSLTAGELVVNTKPMLGPGRSAERDIDMIRVEV
jgi:hypothetical protein